VSRVSQTSVELLLKLRAQGLDQAKEVERLLDEISKTQATGAATATGAAQKQVAASSSAAVGTLNLARAAARLAGAYVSVSTARRAATASFEADKIEQRVLGVLNAQLESREKAVRETERLKRLSKDLFEEFRFVDDDAFLQGIGSGIATSPRILGQEDRFARAAIDLAAALFDGDFNSAAESLAKTLEGTAGTLARQIPELKRIANDLGSPEAFERFLREGGALEVVERRFGGTAASFADSDVGRQLATQARLGDALEELGGAVRAITIPLLELAAWAANGAIVFLDESANGPRPANIRDVLGAAVGLEGEERVAAVEDALRGVEDRLAAVNEELRALGPTEWGSFWTRMFGGRRGQLEDEANELIAAHRSLLNEWERLETDVGGDDGFALPAFALSDDQRSKLIEEIGLIDELTARLNRLKDEFRGVDPTFDPPAGFLISKEEADTETELFFNLAAARETAARLTGDLKDRQEDLNAAIKRANNLAEAGEISDARRFEIIRQSAAELRAYLDTLDLSEAEISEFAIAQQAALDELVSVDLPDVPPFIERLREQLRGARRDLEDLASTTSQLSDELRTRLQDPFAGLIEKAAEGEASILDFADTFRQTLLRLISENLAEDLLGALFGRRQSGGSGLIGGAFDFFGGLLGFADGGVVPGADLGRDSQIIAVRGGEYVVRPEAVRAPGALEFLERLNAAGSAASSRLAARYIPEIAADHFARTSAMIPGYADGGFVDAVGLLGGSGGVGGGGHGGPTAAGPTFAIVANDAEHARRLLGRNNRTAMQDALRENAATIRAIANPAPYPRARA